MQDGQRQAEEQKARQKECSVDSPCVEICALDEQDICIGCQRSAAEITRWGLMDNDERRAVLQRCQQRAQASGQFIARP